jgi:fructokinase
MSHDARVQAPLCVGIGEVLWDLLSAGRSLGGAPINAAAHAVQLGARGAAVSGVGDDADGRDILERLSALHLDVSGVRVVRGLPTGVVDVTLSESGVPTFSVRTPAAWDAIELDPSIEKLAAAADAVLFGSLAQRDQHSRNAIRQFLQSLRPGCLKLFDVNLRYPYYSLEILRFSLEMATVVKLNDTELPVLADSLGIGGDETTRLHALREQFGLDLAVLTRGEGGSRMVTADRDECHPGYPVRVVDTVGAGDAFTAATAMGLLGGLKLDALQGLANRVAAYVCSQPGAIPLFSEEVRREISKALRPQETK